MGMANGLALTTACELAVRRWIKTGMTRGRPDTQLQPPAAPARNDDETR